MKESLGAKDSNSILFEPLASRYRSDKVPLFVLFYFFKLVNHVAKGHWALPELLIDPKFPTSLEVIKSRPRGPKLRISMGMVHNPRSQSPSPFPPGYMATSMGDEVYGEGACTSSVWLRFQHSFDLIMALYDVSKPNTSQRMYRFIQGIIDDQKVMVLIDSGATHNFISTEIRIVMSLQNLDVVEYYLRIQLGYSDEYDKVFNMPRVLPPKSEKEHGILLKEGTEPINVRPYHYPHYQKNEIEKLVKGLL
ncbi:hypothetical protein OSB04_030975 [Centaurea solstitialis]|uniref:Uncharacterized protein n=1 Tax=Centaurea solstitialis TaxID=347529 RepID=A0AA38SS55_9ASTR|nr:hypothetical protein OSB04_030975 [Centaurea solstitialis]